MMRDEAETKADLLKELRMLRKRASELEHMERTIQESEQKWRSIVENVLDTIMIMDREGTISYINNPGLGIVPEKAVGTNIYDYFNANYHNRLRESLRQSFQAGEPDNFELVAEEPNDATSWFNVQLEPIKHGGRIVAVALIAQDIAERKRADESLKKSEKLFREIFENTAVGMYRTTPNGRILMANRALVNMLGFTSFEELSQRNLEEEGYEPCYARSVFKELIEKEGKIVGLESQWIKRDGTVLVIIENARLVRDENGKILYYEGTAEDITQRKRAEEAIRYSEERYRSVVEDSPCMLCRFLPNGEITFVNSAYCEYFGKTSEELIGNKFTSLIPEEDRLFVLDNILSLTVDSPSITHEHKVIAPDGHICWQRWTNRALFDEQGHAVLYQSFGQDITEQRRTERVLAESEEKYRTLIECAGDLISTIDYKGVILFINKLGIETLGYQQEELVGKTLWDIFLKETADRLMTDIRKVIETEQGINTVSLVEINEQSHWYSNTIEPLKDDLGKVTAAMVIARNIDDMKRAEEHIRKLSTAVELSITGIAFSDTKGNLTYVNRSFLEMWGYDNDNEVLGRNATEFWQIPDEGSKVIDILHDRESWIGELTAKRKDGSFFDVQICATSMKGEHGEPTIMGSFIDITESKRKEEELSRYRSQIARAEQLASLGTLSATIAHQLAQPLTVIRLSIDHALDELEASFLSETVIGKLKESLTQVSNITSIVERFRNFARRSSGRTVTEVNLKAVVVRITRLLSESARSANITLRIRNMDNLPCLWMNENDLEQLFFALIENAIQATDGKKARQVIISGAVKNEYIELSISDDCGGIAPENINKIFEPFFTTKPRGRGTGLGLCVVQDAVSRIGGHARVESKFDKGTTFIISLPIE